MNVQCHACIGGTSVGEDIRKLDYGQHIVSGTPGRVFGTICVIFLVKFIQLIIAINLRYLLFANVLHSSEPMAMFA